ncbi:MAG: hypothetical protein R3C10_02465 [Pirellulales bacterium]|nr:hypothetical protein [Planctomycetales bacterium]
MIAPMRPPIQQPDRTTPRDAELRRARRFVAESLLGDEESNAPIAKVKPWRAWALCGWLVAVVVCYVVMLLSTRS